MSDELMFGNNIEMINIIDDGIVARADRNTFMFGLGKDVTFEPGAHGAFVFPYAIRVRDNFIPYFWQNPKLKQNPSDDNCPAHYNNLDMVVHEFERGFKLYICDFVNHNTEPVVFDPQDVLLWVKVRTISEDLNIAISEMVNQYEFYEDSII